jgi:hypothetical protein
MRSEQNNKLVIELEITSWINELEKFIIDDWSMRGFYENNMEKLVKDWNKNKEDIKLDKKDAKALVQSVVCAFKISIETYNQKIMKEIVGHCQKNQLFDDAIISKCQEIIELKTRKELNDKITSPQTTTNPITDSKLSNTPKTHALP